MKNTAECLNPGCKNFGCELMEHLQNQVQFNDSEKTRLTLAQALGFVERFGSLQCPNMVLARRFAKKNFRE